MIGNRHIGTQEIERGPISPVQQQLARPGLPQLCNDFVAPSGHPLSSYMPLPS